MPTSPRRIWLLHRRRHLLIRYHWQEPYPILRGIMVMYLFLHHLIPYPFTAGRRMKCHTRACLHRLRRQVAVGCFYLRSALIIYLVITHSHRHPVLQIHLPPAHLPMEHIIHIKETSLVHYLQSVILILIHTTLHHDPSTLWPQSAASHHNRLIWLLWAHLPQYQNNRYTKSKHSTIRDKVREVWRNSLTSRAWGHHRSQSCEARQWSVEQLVRPPIWRLAGRAAQPLGRAQSLEAPGPISINRHDICFYPARYPLGTHQYKLHYQRSNLRMEIAVFFSCFLFLSRLSSCNLASRNTARDYIIHQSFHDVLRISLRQVPRFTISAHNLSSSVLIFFLNDNIFLIKLSTFLFTEYLRTHARSSPRSHIRDYPFRAHS